MEMPQIRTWVAGLLGGVVFTAGAAPTDRDPSFGQGGLVQFGPTTSVTDLGLYSDGRLAMVVGSRVVRLLVSGIEDPGFGPLEPVSASGVPTHLVVTPDSELVVFDGTYRIPGFSVVAARYRDDGSLDRTFGQEGRAAIGGGSNGGATDPRVSRDGAIFFGFGVGSWAFAAASLQRLSSNGKEQRVIVANSVGLGVVNPDFHDYADVAVPSHDRVIALLGKSERLAVARFADLIPDPSFGEQGVAEYPAPARSHFQRLALAPGGGILAIGTSVGPDAAVMVGRLTASGQLDGAYGSGGFARIDVAPAGMSLIQGTLRTAMQADGKLLIAVGVEKRADAVQHPYVVLLRLTHDGLPDPRFAAGGMTELWDLQGMLPGALAVRDDGRILLAGTLWRMSGEAIADRLGFVMQLEGGDLAEGRARREREAIEYYHAAYGHYFLTSDPEEIIALDARSGSGWARTGERFRVWLPDAGSLAPVCRFWSGQAFAPKSSHFYTPYREECDGLKAGGTWTIEREPFAVELPQGAPGAGTCSTGSRPLHRVYNNGRTGAPNHRYTADAALLDQMIAQGWTFEGEALTRVFACVPLGE